MSTRANVIIQGGGDKLYFYRHSDGYPEVTKKSLEVFMGWLKEGKIRDNIGQAAGWLILLGAAEYDLSREDYETPLHTPIEKMIPSGENRSGMGWKVGAYEPTTGIHGDIEYLYVIDLDKKSLKVVKSGFEKYAA